MTRVRRRELLGLALVAACDRGLERERRTPPTPSVSGAKLSEWASLKFPPSEHYAEEELAYVLRAESKQAPLLVALHGRGEAGRGLPAGAGGWRDEYHLDRARARLASPPLRAEDFHGFVQPHRLTALNASLQNHAYGSLAVACPYTPALSDRSASGAQGFARFVMRSLLPKAAEAAGVELARDRTGIDGVSMGGRLSLLVGLSHPEAFRAVGALQPAIRVSEADELGDLALRAHERKPIALRLVSSERDPFLEAVKALGKALERRKLEHQVVITPGPHDYVWNQGPGSYEMLLWHERVLRGLPAPTG